MPCPTLLARGPWPGLFGILVRRSLCMALIMRGKTECALCHEVIAVEDEIVATSHFIADAKDPFWQYSDAPFHRRCFVAWDRREEFVRRFNEAVRPFVFGNWKRHQMQNDGSITEAEP